MKQEHDIWKRMQAVLTRANELGVTTTFSESGWLVTVPHFHGAEMTHNGNTLDELEMFLKGLRWGLRYAKYKMSDEAQK